MSSSTNQKVAVICGPTASGKSDLAVQLALRLNTEVICADSRQVYKEMQIGTARPLEQDMHGIPHHLCGHVSIHENYDAGRFEQESLPIANRLLNKEKTPILCGGTGLYLKSFCQGLSVLPLGDVQIRKALSSLSLEELQLELHALDPDAKHLVDTQNPQRLIRAIEICKLSNKPLQEVYHEKPADSRPFRCVYFGLNWDRETLYERIEQRCDYMLKNGLLEEVEKLLPHRHHKALLTVGYREFFMYFDGSVNLPKAIELFKRNSRRYAKRQMTWLRNQSRVHWLNPTANNPVSDILSLLK